MDLFLLIKKSLSIAWNNRILWLFGFLSGGLGSVGFLDPGGSSWQIPASNKPQEQMDNVLGVVDPVSTYYASQDFLLLVLLGLLLLLLFLLALILISNWASAALVASILNREKERPTLRSGSREGLKYWWKFYLLSIVMGIIVLFFILMLVLPGLVLFLAQLQGLAVIYTIFAVLIFLVGIFIFAPIGSLIFTLAQRILIHKNSGVLESLSLAGHLVRKNLGESFLTFLVSIGLNFAAGLGVFLAALPIIIVLVLGFLLGSSTGGLLTGIITVGLLGIPALILLFAVGGFWNAFLATYWTLFYEHLASKEGW